MKILLLCFGLSLITCHSFAQTNPAMKPDDASGGDSKLFIKIYGAYGLPTPGSYRSYDINYGYPILYGGFSAAPAGNNVRYQSSSAGLGQGFHVGGGIGAIASDFINLGIDVDYYKSGQITVISYGSKNNNQITITKSDINASMITILPNITFKALSKPSSYIYMRLGIGVGIPTLKQDEVNTLDGKLESSKEYAFKGGLSWGYLVGLGFQKRLSQHLRAFAELQLISFSYAPKERNTKTWLSDVDNDINTPPKDVLADKSIAQKNIEYYDDYTTVNPDPMKPEKSVRLKMPIASLGLQIGLAYRF